MVIFSIKIYIVVMDVVNNVTSSRKSVNTCVVIILLLQDVIHWKTATSYDKHPSIQHFFFLDMTLIIAGPQLVILDFLCYVSTHFTLIITLIG